MPPNSRPRLIGLDLDGTVVDEYNTIPAATLCALQACNEAGIQLAFLTGRRPRTAGPLLEIAGLPAYVATNSGCLIWHFPEWRMLRRQLFPPGLLPRIAELTHPYSVNFYCDTSQTNVEFVQLRREATEATQRHYERYGINSVVVDEVEQVAAYPVSQVALPGPAELTAGLRDKVRAALDGQVLALSVRWPLLPTTALEIFHYEATKGRALEYIASLLGIAQQDCLAVGDDVNDVPMLEWAGHGVAMPAAGPEVIAAADERLAGKGAHVLGPYLTSLLDLPAR